MKRRDIRTAWRHSRRFVGLTALLFSTGAPAMVGCAGPRAALVSPGMEPDALDALEEKLRRRLERHPDDIAAQRDLGHLLWLSRGQTDEALPHLRGAAAGDDWLSLASSMWIAAARREADEARSHARMLVMLASRDDTWSERDAPIYGEITEHALRELNRQTGIRPSVDAEIDDTVDIAALRRRGPSIAVLASIVRTNLALNANASPDAALAARGCVRDWEVSATEGTLGGADLPGMRPALGPDGDTFDAVDGRYIAVPHRCGVRVWNAGRGAAVRRLRTRVTAEAAGLYLEMVSDAEFRLYLDGALVMQNDLTDRWPAGDLHRSVDIPAGVHELELHLAVPGLSGSFMLNALDGAGRPLTAARGAGVPVALSEPLEDPRSSEGAMAPVSLPRGHNPGLYASWRHLLALQTALSEGDYDLAEGAIAHLTEAPFAEAHLGIAAFEGREPSRGGAVSSSRLEAALQRAVDRDPRALAATVELLRIQLGRDEVTEVLAAIEALTPTLREHPDVQMVRFDAYLRRDSDQQAEQALARVAARTPDACRVTRARIALARRLNQFERERALVEAYAPCDRGYALRSEVERRNDTVAPRKRAMAEAEIRPDDMDLLSQIARDHIAEGNPAAALEVLRTQLRYNPSFLPTVRAFVDLALDLGRGDEARAAIQQVAALYPSEPGVLALQELLGIAEDPLLAHRVDGLKMIQQYQDRGEVYEAADVLVLDRDVVWVHDDLSQRHLIHQIVHLQSKGALDTYGEMETPGDGSLLTIRTVKPDGRIVEPEVVPGKSGVSLRELEVGDYVELEYISRRGRSETLPGYLNLGSFRFQSLRRPYHHSELIVHAPSSLPLQIDARGGAPTPSRTERDGRTTLWFLAREMPPVTPEPNARDQQEELPHVRVTTPVDTMAWRRVTESQLRLRFRTNEELRAHTRRLIEGLEDDEAIARRIWTWVMDNVDPAGGDLSVPVTQVFAERKGSCLMLIKAMLNIAGVRSELWLGQSRFAREPFVEGQIDPTAFAGFYLAVWLDPDGPPVGLTPEVKWMPFAYLPQGIAGRAVRLRNPGSVARGDDGAQTPLKGTFAATPPAVADARHYDLNVLLDGDGGATIQGRLELRGAEAIEWREALKMFDRARLGEVFQQAELQRLLPGATVSLERIDLEQESDRELPLTLRFEASATNLGRQGSDGYRMPSALVPMNRSLRYATLPSRASEMAVGYSEPMSARVALRLDRGVFASVPEAVTIEGPFGRYTRAVVEGGEGEASLVFESEAALVVQGVVPDAYPDFLEFARAVQLAEQQEIAVRDP